MGTFDDEIARHLKEALESGELRAAESYGKPMVEDAGWHATPETLRMDLADLVDKNVLMRVGEKKGTYYIIK